MGDFKNLSGQFALVGVAESDELGILPHKSALQLHMEAARNAIADRGRARSEPAAEVPEEPSGEPGPPDQAEQNWVSWRVHRALGSLGEHERSLIELAYWGGLSQSEIANMLGIPLGTVKTRTRSALARLADALEEELR